MANKYSRKNKIRKSLIALLAATAVTCTGLAAACAKDDDDSSSASTKQEDTLVLKNGNFEFYDYPSDDDLKDGKAVYLIKTADDWTRGGDTSNAMSGIIGTSPSAWEALTAADLADRLDYNSDLTYSDEDYVNYNGMTSKDVLYKDTYAALLEDDKVADSYIKNQTYETYFGITERDGKYFIGDTEVYKKTATEEDEEEDIEYYLDEECTISVRKQLIDNPGTHYNLETDDDGNIYFLDKNGEKVKVFEDDRGNYYYYVDGDETNDADENRYFISNVLMVHNHPAGSTYNGISQYFTSSQTITLEANTAAEISVWVKTSDLKFDKGYSVLNDQDRGAFIEVVQTIGGTSVDSLVIKSINTEKILGDSAIADGLTENETSNGWLQYTVYVKACDFASTTIQIKLGLGQSGNGEECTGYAFFDDVTVTKYIDLEADENGSESYAQHKGEVVSCALTNDADEKIFIADKELRNGKNDYRNAKDFYYLIDLASSSGNNHYNTVLFSEDTAEVELTNEKYNGNLYASATSLDGVTVSGLRKVNDTYQLPKGWNNAIITSSDLVGAFGANESGFASSPYASTLKEALTGENGIASLPDYNEQDAGNMLVMLSRYGAAYTSTVSGNQFAVPAGEYRIVSFWVKTSDMKGKAAATINITDGDENSASIYVDSTGVTTDIGDNEDIYGGWVQCFFFVENDTDSDRNFEIEICFGNTTIYGTAVNAYDYGWIAVANLQTLEIDETVYDLAPSDSYTQTFSFTEDSDDNSGNVFDSASGTSDIKNGIANPSSYDGVNGGSSYVSDSDYRENYDKKNANYVIDGNGDKTQYAGLINRDNFADYANWQDIVSGFTNTNYSDASTAWEAVFGKDCYQPLIIMSSLREYCERTTATEETFNNGDYFVEAEDDYAGDVISANGKLYRKVGGSDTYSEDTAYYSLKDIVKVANYGFIGSSRTISSSTYETISVKVLVSSDTDAYIYLVNPETREVLTYEVPDYSFYYDDDGNVLDEQFDSDWDDATHRKHIVYKLLDNGLYEDEDGNLFANTHNLIKSYNYYKFADKTYYNTDGELVMYKDVEEGETYYYDADLTEVAEHYLVNSEGKRIYLYTNGDYYYVDGTQDLKVTPFATEYARDGHDINAPAPEYMVHVPCTMSGNWVYVNFFIHTDSEALTYRLELWNGERDATGVDEDGNYSKGAIAFDYSAFKATDFSMLENDDGTGYAQRITEEYGELLDEYGLYAELKAGEKNIAYYEEFIEQAIADGKLSGDELEAFKTKYYSIHESYNAMYYTYSLYDSTAYVPFNADTAKEEETGYVYKASSYSETLAYFRYYDEKLNSFNVFFDLSAIDQNIEIGTVTDDTDDDTGSDGNGANIALYVASIVLVVALLITLVSLLIRERLSKLQRAKGDKLQARNNYRKRQRYIRKLHLVENNGAEETPEATDNGATEDTVTETTVEESVEEAPSEVAENAENTESGDVPEDKE